MIKIKKLNKYFFKNKKKEIHVINDTSLELEDKGLVSLLGPSGSGKTTLLNVIGGLDKPNTGEIYINNKRLTRVSNSKVDKIRNLDIGYIFQNFNLIDDMTVYDNVSLVLKMIGIKDKNEIKKRVNYVLETLGIYKYRHRLAGLLSGGERQRVAIARAIVKNPSIIIADEPTGNLDSKNTIEIMNIIKSISKDKLVILVTHEKELAYFYSSRIIELLDGKIINDIVNKDNDELDYRIDNKIYLKDMKNHEKIKSNNINIDYYTNNDNKINVKIVVKNNTIYIETNEKSEIINEDSAIELVDDSYKKITKEESEKYKFDYDNIINKDIKLKYSSIYNPISMLKSGFKKLKSYSVLKKILLSGFFISSMFVVYSVSNILGILDIQDKEFISRNKNYLSIESNEILKDKYEEYKKIENINYILPGDSIVNFDIHYNFYYQTNYALDSLNGSLSSIKMIDKDDLIYGRMPTSEYEIVVDKMSIDKLIDNYTCTQVGLLKTEDFINLIVNINNMKDFTIVGITNLQSPSIYTDESMFIDILSNSNDNMYWYEDSEDNLINYKLKEEEFTLKKGSLPNEYEVIVNYEDRYTYELNKTIDIKVNDKKLKVVGYYESKTLTKFLTNEITMEDKLIDDNKEIVVYPVDKLELIQELNKEGINIKDTYSLDRQKYIDEHKDTMISSCVVAGIILIISLVEIFLIIRSSFLSRIKEVGTLRAIGVKKSDIYKMFLGEILSITLTASLLGYLIMLYIVHGLVTLPIISGNYIFNTEMILISASIIVGFNILVGLLPVYFTIRKTPAAILSRTDID